MQRGCGVITHLLSGDWEISFTFLLIKNKGRDMSYGSGLSILTGIKLYPSVDISQF